MATTFRVGDMTIHRIVEMEQSNRPALEFLPNLTRECLDENRSWLQPAALDAHDNIVLCFQSYVVVTPNHTILIDTCIGNDKSRPLRPHWHQKTDRRYMDGLAAIGLCVKDIDYVMCTHLHVDHVGWNTRLENGHWVPTFPNARYVLSRKELDFWTARNLETAVPWIEDSVLPIVHAARAELVTSDHILTDHVRLLPTPGHTVDHFAVALGRGTPGAFVTGDLIHSPLQARYPELHMRLDHDPALAVATRRSFLESCCASGTLTCFAHFPSPSVGLVKRWGDGFRCQLVF
jgi:glyoxylase-like metal-dependent hydrolase (beta-lactamase superfamily II)